MTKILLTEDLSWKQKMNALEMSLIMGFHTTSAEFPVTSKEEGMKVPENLRDLQEILRQKLENGQRIMFQPLKMPNQYQI